MTVTNTPLILNLFHYETIQIGIEISDGLNDFCLEIID
ncbi:hypothetical protein PULV_a3552 [Pseudoalteromonas ulvae UL12]|nr:hypothetical protein [Pseudoalteromonas ulvae UL12]